MKTVVTMLLTHLFLLGCSINSEIKGAKLYQEHFPGFSFSTTSNTPQPSLSGYEYQIVGDKKLVITSCEQADGVDISTIADYDYFRFKMLLVSCVAIDKYSTATVAQENSFPSKLDKAFIYQLPATIVPLVSKADGIQRQGQSIKSYDPDTQITTEKENSFKLLTAEDEVYLTLLARGDFTNDGREELLIQSEWYARTAHGKHVDLLILSRPGDGGAVEISWRLNKLD